MVNDAVIDRGTLRLKSVCIGLYKVYIWRNESYLRMNCRSALAYRFFRIYAMPPRQAAELDEALRKKGGLTLSQLANYDDIITDALVDRVSNSSTSQSQWTKLF